MRNKLKKVLDKSDSEYLHENPEYLRSREFAKVYKKGVRQQLAECGLELASFHPGYCECSGFITDGNACTYVYFSSGDYRLGNVFDNVLIRTASSTSDYKGGMNNYCRIEEIGKRSADLLKEGGIC